jgi:hypothetical protein
MLHEPGVIGENALGVRPRTSTDKRAIVVANMQSVVIGAILLLAFATRGYASIALPNQNEEPNSLLAAHMVADHGVPMLPSGVLYLHGATLSYLAAPAVWLGIGEIDQLQLMRLFSVICGVVTVFLTFRLALRLTHTNFALVAAGLVAIDPLSVLWGGRFRMYAIEQMFVVASCLAFIALVAPQKDERQIDERWKIVKLVSLYWLAVFAHLGAALLLPAMGLAALFTVGLRRLVTHVGVVVALALCAAAPVTAVALTSLWGRGSTTVGSSPDALPFVSFLGDNHFVKGALIHPPEFRAWFELFEGSALSGIMPLVMVASSLATVIGIAWLMRTCQKTSRMRAISAIVILYWVPILSIALLTTGGANRYILFLQPLGYGIVVAAAGLLISLGRAVEHPIIHRLAGLVVVGLIVVIGVFAADGVRQLPSRRELFARNFAPAIAFVKEHHQPGQAIVVRATPEAYLVLGAHPDLRYWAAEAGSDRADRTILTKSDGSKIDYWIGATALRNVEDVCTLFLEHPGSWIVGGSWIVRPADDQTKRATSRKREDPKPIAPMATVLQGSSEERFRTVEDATAFQVKEPSQWDSDARRACNLPVPN